MMGIVGFKTEKELRAGLGQIPEFIETSMFGNEFHGDGTYTIVGPSPQVRKWYATVTVTDGLMAKVA